MTTAISETPSAAHAVALSRLQARRGDDDAAVSPLPAAAPTGFADTAPLWFRSEAFAEDVACGMVAELPVASPRSLRRIDAHMIEAGAAVLRLTLQALQLRRRS